LHLQIKLLHFTGSGKASFPIDHGGLYMQNLHQTVFSTCHFPSWHFSKHGDISIYLAKCIELARKDIM
jgi:hypothetical protein